MKCASYVGPSSSVSDGNLVFTAALTASWVFVSLVAILTSCRKRIEGHLCLCKKPRSDGGGMLSSLSWGSDAAKNDFMDFCKKGAIPLTFHEKIRMLFVCSGGRGCGVVGLCFAVDPVV